MPIRDTQSDVLDKEWPPSRAVWSTRLWLQPQHCTPLPNSNILHGHSAARSTARKSNLCQIALFGELKRTNHKANTASESQLPNTPRDIHFAPPIKNQRQRGAFVAANTWRRNRNVL